MRRSTFAGVVGQGHYCGLFATVSGTDNSGGIYHVTLRGLLSLYNKLRMLCCVTVVNRSLYLKVYRCLLSAAQARSFVYTRHARRSLEDPDNRRLVLQDWLVTVVECARTHA